MARSHCANRRYRRRYRPCDYLPPLLLNCQCSGKNNFLELLFTNPRGRPACRRLWSMLDSLNKLSGSVDYGTSDSEQLASVQLFETQLFVSCRLVSVLRPKPTGLGDSGSSKCRDDAVFPSVFVCHRLPAPRRFVHLRRRFSQLLIGESLKKTLIIIIRHAPIPTKPAIGTKTGATQTMTSGMQMAASGGLGFAAP